jgi:hypothetical protein
MSPAVTRDGSGGGAPVSGTLPTVPFNRYAWQAPADVAAAAGQLGEELNGAGSVTPGPVP